VLFLILQVLKVVASIKWNASILLLRSSGAVLGSKVMRDVMELLRAKEQELLKVKRQVEALRIVLPLLGAEEDPLVPRALPVNINGTEKLG
jgi:hypothetical protein